MVNTQQPQQLQQLEQLAALQLPEPLSLDVPLTPMLLQLNVPSPWLVTSPFLETLLYPLLMEQ